MMMINQNSNDIKRIIIIFLVLVFFSYTFYSARKNDKELTKNSIYSVAYFKSRGSNWMTSEFKFRGKMYKVKSGGGPRIAFVQFSPNDPRINYLMYKLKVPKCLSRDSIPDEGWKELPVINCPE